MAPNGETIASSFSINNNKKSFSKPPKLSIDHGLQRTVSDISFELSKEEFNLTSLPPISEVEDAKCECCGMSEECTPEYINGVRDKYLGKWICGLCDEAVKEEFEKNGGDKEKALSSHINECERFNKYGRAYPVLYQAEAMREMLKKCKLEGRGIREKSISPRDIKGRQNKGGIARSTSCIPAITREIDNLTMAN